jgi:hypothetical protein
MGICYHYIRECVEEGDKINLFYIPTDEQLADFLSRTCNLSNLKLLIKVFILFLYPYHNLKEKC